jgi:hypothetical protein
VGTGEAVLPAGLDLAAYSAVPGRIAAAMRRMPRAADSGDGPDDGPLCKTCDGRGRLLHPVTGHKGKVCPSCGGTGVYSPQDAAQDRWRGGQPGPDFRRQLELMRAALPSLKEVRA